MVFNSSLFFRIGVFWIGPQEELLWMWCSEWACSSQRVSLQKGGALGLMCSCGAFLPCFSVLSVMTAVAGAFLMGSGVGCPYLQSPRHLLQLQGDVLPAWSRSALTSPAVFSGASEAELLTWSAEVLPSFAFLCFHDATCIFYRVSLQGSQIIPYTYISMAFLLRRWELFILHVSWCVVGVTRFFHGRRQRKIFMWFLACSLISNFQEIQRKEGGWLYTRSM